MTFVTINPFGVPDERAKTVVIGPVPDGLLYPTYRAGEWVSDPSAHAATEAVSGVVAAKASVPSSVTRRQAIQALRIHGITKAMVTDALAAIPDDLQRDLAMIEWEDSQVFERNRELVASMGAAFGMDEAQLDALFVEAANL